MQNKNRYSGAKVLAVQAPFWAPQQKRDMDMLEQGQGQAESAGTAQPGDLRAQGFTKV